MYWKLSLFPEFYSASTFKSISKHPSHKQFHDDQWNLVKLCCTSPLQCLMYSKKPRMWQTGIIKYHQPRCKKSFIEINKMTRLIKQNLSTHGKIIIPFITFLIFKVIEAGITLSLLLISKPSRLLFFKHCRVILCLAADYKPTSSWKATGVPKPQHSMWGLFAIFNWHRKLLFRPPLSKVKLHPIYLPSSLQIAIRWLTAVFVDNYFFLYINQ